MMHRLLPPVLSLYWEQSNMTCLRAALKGAQQLRSLDGLPTRLSPEWILSDICGARSNN
jgi:hypothetical protein